MYLLILNFVFLGVNGCNTNANDVRKELNQKKRKCKQRRQKQKRRKVNSVLGFTLSDESDEDHVVDGYGDSMGEGEGEALKFGNVENTVLL